MICTLCPKRCKDERNDDNNIGFCKAPFSPKVARAALHFGEEPCISGKKGSGTVFFSGCSLSCVFCQNSKISHESFGKTVTVERLAEIFKELYYLGAENINLVNPTHYCYAISKAFEIYKPPIPVIYNSSGYESEETLNIAFRFADVFLLDLKYLDENRALRYSGAANYPETAVLAIIKCAKKIGENSFNENGLMTKGLIVRHLILPMGTNDAVNVIDWVSENVPWAVLSLMSQYTPCGDLDNFPEINRKITKRELEKVLSFAAQSNIDKIYTQELSSVGKEFIPNFDLTGV